MKFVSRILLLLIPLAATLTSAQTLKHFDHIVIIVQENRTPDNLFGAGPNVGCGAPNAFEPGVDIQDGGPASGRGVLCNRPTPLYWGDADLDHSYSGGWLRMWDGGSRDGACGITIYGTDSAKLPVCPQYTYVNKSDVQPYFDIATNYGFANYRGC